MNKFSQKKSKEKQNQFFRHKTDFRLQENQFAHIDVCVCVWEKWILNLQHDYGEMIRTCFRRSGVKSGKLGIVELETIDVALPPFDKLFWYKLLFLCCSCAPGALLVLLCELLEPMLEVLADSQLSLLPLCNACDHFNLIGTEGK